MRNTRPAAATTASVKANMITTPSNGCHKGPCRVADPQHHHQRYARRDEREPSGQAAVRLPHHLEPDKQRVHEDQPRREEHPLGLLHLIDGGADGHEDRAEQEHGQHWKTRNHGTIRSGTTSATP